MWDSCMGPEGAWRSSSSTLVMQSTEFSPCQVFLAASRGPTSSIWPMQTGWCGCTDCQKHKGGAALP